MVASLRVLSLPTDPNPRIVDELERILGLAKEGKVTGYFIFYSQVGDKEMSRDGFTDEEILFNVEVMKARLLEKYR